MCFRSLESHSLSNHLNDRTGEPPVAANTAVLVLDMISAFDYEDGDRIRAHAMRIKNALADLTDRARKTGVPVIFVNDNFGKWTEDFGTYVDTVKKASEESRQLVEQIGPKRGDYHILKPQRSAFYATPLEVLLLTLKINDLVLTGITTDICVLFTAHDAYMRGYKITVAPDCTAALEDEYHRTSLEFLRRVIHAEIKEAGDIRFNGAPAGDEM
jgi:nicotinamidase-related amidase